MRNGVATGRPHHYPGEMRPDHHGRRVERNARRWGVFYRLPRLLAIVLIGGAILIIPQCYSRYIAPKLPPGQLEQPRPLHG